MIYRMRIYRAVDTQLATFHRFFNEVLLPIQLRHGARLVGRWQTEDCRVVAIWEYDDRSSYERIQRSVAEDPESIAAQEYRQTIPPFMHSYEDVLMTDTVAR